LHSPIFNPAVFWSAIDHVYCNVTNQTANCDTYSANFGILWQTYANENHSYQGACDMYFAKKVTKSSNTVTEIKHGSGFRMVINRSNHDIFLWNIQGTFFQLKFFVFEDVNNIIFFCI